ncbi:PAS-domain containing protein [Profundibacter sp.]
MSHTLINAKDSLKRQNEKLLKISSALMRRVEQGTDTSGVAYAQFQRAVMLEQEVRLRTQDLERALDLLNDSNAHLAQANAETEAARNNLANAIEAVQEGFALFDPDDHLVMSNRRFGKHLQDIYHHFQPGLNYTEYVRLVSHSSFLTLPEDVTPPQWAARRMRRHKDDHVVYNARLTDRRWLQVSEHRTADGGTVVLQTDVTNMVRMERKERDRLLDDQDRIIRATLEHLNQGICIFDSQNQLVGWNRRVGEMLAVPIGWFQNGIPFDTLYRQLRQGFEFPAAFAPKTIDAWANRKIRAATLSFEIHADKGLTLAAFAQHIPDDGFVISFTDITAERTAVQAISEANETLERRVTERTLELEDALAEAERANASKSRFVAAASHDLLQPMSAAKLFITSLETELQSPELLDRLAKASNALLSMENILGALLDISKLDSGKVAVHISDVPLELLLQQLCDEFSPIASQKGLKLVFVPTRVVVKSDATFLRRIVQNLISNAIRYTESGTVLVGVRHHKDTVSLEVLDTGLGIPENQQEIIFEEFHRLNASSSAAEGMGLGLAIVDRACRLLEHPLQIASTLDKGTRFSVVLPRSKKPIPSTLKHIFPKEPTRNCIDGSVILLIENKAELRNAITITIEGWGAGVFPCASEAEAMSLLDEVDIVPDAIMVDYQLDDGLLGTDAITNLRARFGPVPSCLITANPSNALEGICKKMGVKLFHKPLDITELRRFFEKCGRDT